MYQELNLGIFVSMQMCCILHHLTLWTKLKASSTRSLRTLTANISNHKRGHLLSVSQLSSTVMHVSDATELLPQKLNTDMEIKLHHYMYGHMILEKKQITNIRLIKKRENFSAHPHLHAGNVIKVI